MTLGKRWRPAGGGVFGWRTASYSCNAMRRRRHAAGGWLYAMQLIISVSIQRNRGCCSISGKLMAAYYGWLAAIGWLIGLSNILSSAGGGLSAWRCSIGEMICRRLGWRIICGNRRLQCRLREEGVVIGCEKSLAGAVWPVFGGLIFIRGVLWPVAKYYFVSVMACRPEMLSIGWLGALGVA